MQADCSVLLLSPILPLFFWIPSLSQGNPNVKNQNNNKKTLKNNDE